MTTPFPTAFTLTLTLPQWQAWLASLVELEGERLALRAEIDAATTENGDRAGRDIDTADVDEYVLSAYAEALQSTEVDGELWETYHDLELEGAADDAAAWAEIMSFYAERGCVLVRAGERGAWEEEWILGPELVQRLELARWAK